MTTLQTYIADGFLEDCEELIHALTEKFEKVDWHKFCYFWKKMDFDILFYGRQTGPEIVEYTEELLQTARLYMVTETDNFESQVIGLFIAYAITITQPYKNLLSLRLVPSDVKSLKRFEDIVRRDGRKDVLMILGKMYLLGKVHFHVSVRERAMDLSIRKYFDGTTNVPVCIARRWHGVLDRHRIKAFENLSKDEAQYQELKRRTRLVTEATLPGMARMQTDTFKPQAMQIADSLRKLTTKQSKEEESDDDTYVSQVKLKAMKKIVNPMKHLHGLDARQKAIETQPETSKAPKSYKAASKTSKAASKLKSKTAPKTAEPELETTFSKQFSSDQDEVPCKGISLPSLDDPPLNPPETELEALKEHSQVLSKGFHKEEIKSSNNNKELASKPKIISQVKGKDNGKSSKLVYNRAKTQKKRTDLTEKMKPKDKTSPVSNGKRKNVSDQDTTKKKKKKVKNKLNKKLRLSTNFKYDDSDSNTSTEITDTPENEDKEIEMTDTETCKSKELTIQSKGVVKHFVEYEVNDNIIIRTEKDVPPIKDIEIEYIDNYTGTNAYEEICELSDEEDPKQDKILALDNATSQSNKETIECDDSGDIEVFQVVNDTEELNINQTRTLSETLSSMDRKRRAEDDETMKRIISNTNAKRYMGRKKFKLPTLRSKLKKMGLLPFANFDNDSK